ncbi:MAG: hypothetical protein A2Y24_07240 [Clostridiales bacterium GWE2_32_10]|nr:MAG: hypothetical protein A2Y24_07240 [Clostridiales bacterium GWE2_32_10]HBY20870.1 CBS domain-containing protein [Clostridiales bacterium]
MRVEDYMSKNIILVNADDNLVKAARIMQEANIGCLPVERNDEIVGMITDRDIVVRAVASEKNISNVKCEDVMSHSAICIDKNEDIHGALEFMSEHKIRRLPVTDNGDLVGMISIGDIADSECSNEFIGNTLEKISEKTYESRKI